MIDNLPDNIKVKYNELMKFGYPKVAYNQEKDLFEIWIKHTYIRKSGNDIVDQIYSGKTKEEAILSMYNNFAEAGL